MDDIFFHKKGKRILLALNKNKRQNVSEIAKNIEGTYAHTFNLLKEMEGLGITKSSKEGRTKYIELMPRGKRLVNLILDFEKTLKKKVKKEVFARTTPTHEKLEKYRDSLESISSDVKSKKPRKKDVGKYLRILGRYKSLVQKLRPKDKAGKSQKSDALSLIEEIYSMLKK